jgi:hypothetical protein
VRGGRRCGRAAAGARMAARGAVGHRLEDQRARRRDGPGRPGRPPEGRRSRPGTAPRTASPSRGAASSGSLARRAPSTACSSSPTRRGTRSGWLGTSTTPARSSPTSGGWRTGALGSAGPDPLPQGPDGCAAAGWLPGSRGRDTLPPTPLERGVARVTPCTSSRARRR